MEPEAAAAALADIERTRVAATRRRRTPLWVWHAFAGSQTALIGVLMLLPRNVAGAVAWLGIPLGFGLQRLCERRMATRMFEGSARAKRVGRWYLAGAVVAILAAGAMMIGLRSDWPFLPAMVICYLLTVWLGPLSERDLDRPEHPAAT